MSGFSNPIANRIGELIRQALQSDNFVAGVSGWIIRKNGTAEFNSTIIRGSLDVTDIDGSRIHIFDEDPGDGAIIDMYPATPVAHTITTPVEFRTTLVTDRPEFQIEGATIDGVTPGPLMFMDADELGNQSWGAIAPNLFLKGILSNQSPSLFGPGSLDIQNADVNIHTDRVGITSTLEIDGGIRAGERVYVGSIVSNKTLCFEKSVSFSKGPAAVDTKANNVFADMKDSTGASYQHFFEKTYGAAESDLLVTIHVTMTNQAATSNNFTIQVNEPSQGVSQILIDSQLMNIALNTHEGWSATRRFTGLNASTGLFLKPQWRRDAGAGTLARDGNTYLNIVVEEVGI